MRQFLRRALSRFSPRVKTPERSAPQWLAYPVGETRLAQESRFTVGILGWIVLGLIAGAIAKAILPGRQGGGWIATLILGVVGALLGGFIGSAVFGIGLEEFWSLQTWIVAIVGAIIVLLIYGLVTRGSRSRA
jgi:uncharacterized membrane protein YeaQ/YmgE (transglycosylase-associated protein family)